jgi:hypothetical protein
MRSRCGVTACCNPSAKKYYVDRGIKICAEWDSFETFAAWALSHGYADHLTIDRKRSNLDYEPSNCRWVTMEDNLRNRAA